MATKHVQRRATVYLDPDLHKALRLKAAEVDRSISDLVNEALRDTFGEDAFDSAIVRKRAHEPRRPFEDFLSDLKRRGKI